MSNKLNIGPCSTAWLSDDDIGVSEYLYGWKFRKLKDLLPVRVYDFLNFDRMNAIKAEEFIICLYKYLHPENESYDDDLYNGYIDQTFNFRGFMRTHKPENVTIGDLVLDDDMNREALYDLLDKIKHCFWRSPEYDWHCYKFANKAEYLAALENRKQASV